MTADKAKDLALGKKVADEQSIGGAVFGALMGSVISVMLWLLGGYWSAVSLFYIPVMGLIVGGMTVFCGRGIDIRFGFIGVGFTAFTVIVCCGWSLLSFLGIAMALPTLALGFIASMRRLSTQQSTAYDWYEIEQGKLKSEKR